MTPKKQEHFVPQWYLRRFTHDGTRLHAFDKINLRVFSPSIEKIARERAFYDLPTEPALSHGIDPTIAEDILARIENTHQRAIQRVIDLAEEGATRVLDQSSREVLAHFLVVQNLRTRERRANLHQMFQKLGEKLGAHSGAGGEPHPMVVPDRASVDLFHTSQVLNPKMVATLVQAIVGHIWFLGLNSTGQPLYTSDHPFVRRPHYTHPHLSMSGLASTSIELACPLSPRHLLVLCERGGFAAYRARDNSAIPLSSDNVTYYNSLQVFQSYRQVYSVTPDFTLAARICDEHPEARNPGRTRVILE